LDNIYASNLPENQFEVLCINDCSPDNVQEILEWNQKKHDNMRIIVHQQNRGLGGARNTGIREAKGKYLWFVDSDDLVITQGLKTLIKKAINEDLDILCFNYCRVDQEGREISKHLVFNDNSTQGGYIFVKSVFGKDIVNHLGYVWRFIYRTEYLRRHQLFFPEQVRWEDTVFMPQALLGAERVAAVPDVLYSYRVNANSISGTFGSAYPASLIFEYAICAGGDLLRFSDEVKDEELKGAFHDTAIYRYINGFPLHLFRTSRLERKKFYALTKRRMTEVNQLRRDMTMFRKLLLLPIVGPVLAEISAAVYGVNRKRQ
jgi:glycosyltransferase involved in cell wall biosynthesis